MISPPAHKHLLPILLLTLSCNTKKPTTIAVPEELKYPDSYVAQLAPQIDYALAEVEGDGKELRIWINEALFSPNRLIELKDYNNFTYKKSIKFYSRHIRPSNFRLDSLSLSNAPSELNLDTIFSALNDLGFDEVQPMSDSLWQRINDGTTFVVEMKNGPYYKSINCNSPFCFTDNNSKQLDTIIKYLSSIFGFQYYGNVYKRDK